MRPLTPDELMKFIGQLDDYRHCRTQFVIHVGLAQRVPPGALRISVGPDQEDCSPMITLPSHKTFSNKKTPISLSPAYTDDSGTTVPDADAVVGVVSSDASVGVERDSSGQWWITTPLDEGAATITISASSPHADYDSAQLDFSYGPPIAGQLNVSVGTDVPDA